MAKFEVITGGQPEVLFGQKCLGEDFAGTVAPLTPEQFYKLQSTGRDTEELDEYEAALAAAARLAEVRQQTLYVIEGGAQ